MPDKSAMIKRQDVTHQTHCSAQLHTQPPGFGMGTLSGYDDGSTHSGWCKRRWKPRMTETGRRDQAAPLRSAFGVTPFQIL